MCQDGILRFEMSDYVPIEWSSVLAGTNFPHKFLEDYDKSRVTLYFDNSLGMKLRGGETANQLAEIISNMREWVSATNAIFNEQEKQRPLIERENEEKKRREEIELNLRKG